MKDSFKACESVLTITSNDLGLSWGPAVHYLELWNEFSKLSHDIKVKGVAPSWSAAPPIIKPCFDLKRLKVPNIRTVRQLIYDFMVAILLLLTMHKYTLIYVRLSHWHLLQILVLRLFRKPYIIELNGLTKEDSDSAGKNGFITKVIQWQEKALIEGARGVISVSEGIRQAVLSRYKISSKSIKSIRNGVSTALFETPRLVPSMDKTSLRAIYVGTFTSWDGSDLIPYLAEGYPDIIFDVVGDGDRRAEIEARSPTNVRFHGIVNYGELPSFYGNADFGVVLYEFERHRNVQLSSLKTLEYLAAKLPVFTTAVPGQEFIDEMGVGYLLAENESILDGFKVFLSRLTTYSTAYCPIESDLPDRFGWKSTAKQTLEFISDQRVT